MTKLTIDEFRKINTNSYNFFVVTYGSFTGSNAKDMEKILANKCLLCLGCMHRCPEFAIQYRNTRKHGQYTNPNTKI